MLVSIDQELTSPRPSRFGRFGEVVLSSDGRLMNPTNVVEPGAPRDRPPGGERPPQIVLDDGDGRQNIDPTVYPAGGLSASNTLRVGDTTDGGTFVFEQRFGVYRLQPTGDAGGLRSRRTRGRRTRGRRRPRHASRAMNVLNYFNGDGLGGGLPDRTRAPRHRSNSSASAPRPSARILGLDADVIGINELENDDGPNSAIEDLVDGPQRGRRPARTPTSTPASSGLTRSGSRSSTSPLS